MRNMDIPNCFYRVSIKALVLDETRKKFLVAQEENGKWELLGGALDWGATPQEDLQREIKEETGLEVARVAEHPSYFLTDINSFGQHIAQVLYETALVHLNFTPSDECVALQFVSKEEAQALTPQFGNVALLGKLFDPKRHSI